MEEQRTFLRVPVVVEVFAGRQFEAFRRASDPAQVLYGVRCVRATPAGGGGEGRLTYLGCHHDDKNQLAEN